MKILMVAAFPPPICGQSLAAQLLKTGLTQSHVEVVPLDLSEPLGGDPFFKRLRDLILLEGRLFLQCIVEKDKILYLQLGHGRTALMRDLVFLATSSLTKTPSVVHVHGSGFRTAFDRLPFVLRYLERKCLSHVSAAVVLSESLKSMFSEIVDDSRIFAVDNGIDPEFVSMTSHPSRTRQDDALHILYLSNFLTAKGFDTLLETARLSQMRGKNWIFDFVGARVPGERVDIDQYIQTYQLKNVRVSDVVTGERKHEAYQNADIFVLPSLYEGQPLCLLEALFESLPIITTRVGGIPEIFSDETCVRYIDTGNEEQLYHSICELEDPALREKMKHAARHLALSRFTPQAHIDRMISILKQAFEATNRKK